MAYTPISIILLLSLTPSLFLHIQHIHAQTPSAPAPSPPGPINLTAILDKAGQYNTFIRLLTQTQAGNQIDNQVNSSTEGLTVFAPTDNAFSNLPPGTLNKLSDNQQVQLILYHVLPKFYTVQSLETVSNPVRTQASGQDGQPFGLNFTGQSNQLNVSTGVVDTQIYNALRKDPPLAVYQVDKVLLPLEFTRSPAPGSSPPSSAAKPEGGGGAGAGNTTTTAGEASPPSPGGAAHINVGLGLVSGLLVICMGMFS